MNRTSAAFGVRFPDADGAAGPDAWAGAGDIPRLLLAALVHAELRAAMPATAIVMDRNTVFMRLLPTVGHFATRSARLKNVCRVSIIGKRPRRDTAELQLATEWARHEHGSTPKGYDRPVHDR